MLNLPPDYCVEFVRVCATCLFLASQKHCLFSLSAVSPRDTDSNRELSGISAFGRLWLMREESFTGHFCQVCPLSRLIAFCQVIFSLLRSVHLSLKMKFYDFLETLSLHPPISLNSSVRPMLTQGTTVHH